MSFIHMIEQLGANAALQQLNQAQRQALFSGKDTETLHALLKGDIDGLSELLKTPVYRCVLQVPPEQQDEQPAEEDDKAKPQQSAVKLQ